MDEFKIMRNVCEEIQKEKRIEKFKNIDTIDIIQELSERINSNLYVLCPICEEENKKGFDKYFGLENNFHMRCDYPLCKKHIHLANECN